MCYDLGVLTYILRNKKQLFRLFCGLTMLWAIFPIVLLTGLYDPYADNHGFYK